MVAETINVVDILSQNEVLRSFLFYSSILVVKMLLMSPYTGMTRMKFKAFANTEDCAKFKVKPTVNDNVERIRRAHLNDLENITLFFIMGFVYSLTSPDVCTATWLFRMYTASRVLHTVAFAVFAHIPSRATSYAVGFGITLYMVVRSVIHFF